MVSLRSQPVWFSAQPPRAALVPLRFAAEPPAVVTPQQAEKTAWRALQVAVLSGMLLIPLPGLVGHMIGRAETPPSPGHVMKGDVTGAQAVLAGFVDKATDIPGLSKDVKVPFIPLKENPFLSPKARQAIEEMVREMNGRLGVVIIPDSHQKALGPLAQDIYTTLGLGAKGKNDGALVLVNAKQLLALARSGTIWIEPGHGLKDKLTSQLATELVVKHAVPEIQLAEKAATPEAKRQHLENAVVQTVKAVQQVLKDNPSDSPLNPAWLLAAVIGWFTGLFGCIALDAATRSRGIFTEVYIRITLAVLTAGKAGGGRGGYSSGGGGGR